METTLCDKRLLERSQISCSRSCRSFCPVYVLTIIMPWRTRNWLEQSMRRRHSVDRLTPRQTRRVAVRRWRDTNTASTFSRTLMRWAMSCKGEASMRSLGQQWISRAIRGLDAFWESFGPDPFLAGEGSYETIIGMHSAGKQACAKHFVANNQEHRSIDHLGYCEPRVGRAFVDVLRHYWRVDGNNEAGRFTARRYLLLIIIMSHPICS
ncbi:glycosyl hydrolase 3 family protein [Pleurotus pulmonarius]